MTCHGEKTPRAAQSRGRSRLVIVEVKDRIVEAGSILRWKGHYLFIS